MNEIVTEPAAAADVPRLLEIRHAAFAAHAPQAYSPAEVETLIADVDPDELYAMAADARLFVARAGTVIVGLAGCVGDRLRHVYVDPGYTRRGIATVLVGRVEDEVRERTGRRLVRAGVALHARGFYLANGYVLDRLATAWDGSSYAEMVKRLPT
ncbi:hypothetical protein Asp14428_70780 [Actinoplanes sp. NBRC 14428]|uniref:GNAT family acetyltransferase n=1 Tax=Pseudosporangium ferrugineum TaxID=439699 RepID=A0A2T0S2H1_9ACTN|nr:GNAT family N-acetyltransferase [Pseudosporangium ferrugineum]PRY27627.1 GNAT family acetyltransferase [Pseudosporangium ferrugineum]BCJ55603.1 hypothetical protein Asp14428_70780 [Actinoplanes sp. NBRC 14428]